MSAVPKNTYDVYTLRCAYDVILLSVLTYKKKYLHIYIDYTLYIL